MIPDWCFYNIDGKLEKVKETAPRYYLRFCDAGSRNQAKKYGNFYLDRNLVLKIYRYHKCPNLVRTLMQCASSLKDNFQGS